MPKPFLRGLKAGDHVVYDHKCRKSYGILVEFADGLFGEPRAIVDWVWGRGSPFAVCVENLTLDTCGVVSGVLGSLRNAKAHN